MRSNSISPITLYAVPTANSQRVAIMLEEVCLPYRLHLVNRAIGEQHTPEFRAINPTGMAPVIVDPNGPDGVEMVVTQSGAILLYLAERTGRLLPADGTGRAHVQQWLLHVLSDVQAASAALFIARQKVGDPHAATVNFFEQRLFGFLSDCDRTLQSMDFLAGEFSIADVALFPVVWPRKDALEERGLNALARWMRRAQALPTFQRGMNAIRS